MLHEVESFEKVKIPINKCIRTVLESVSRLDVTSFSLNHPDLHCVDRSGVRFLHPSRSRSLGTNLGFVLLFLCLDKNKRQQFRKTRPVVVHLSICSLICLSCLLKFTYVMKD